MSKATEKVSAKKKASAPKPMLSEAVYEWRILVRRTAAGVGALCGLVSLLYGAPAWVACVRGGAASFLIAVLGRQGERFLTSSDRADLADDRTESPSTSPPAATAAPAAATPATEQ